MTRTTTDVEADHDAMHAGWCPDCDLPSVVIDGGDGAAAWAECTECGVGWVHRDDLPDAAPSRGREHARAA